MDGKHDSESRKYCAVLAIGIGILAGAGMMMCFGAVDGASQMIRMYLSAGCGLLLAFACFKLFTKLAGSKELFSGGSAADGEGGSGLLYGVLTALPCLIAFSLMQDIFTVVTVESALGSYVVCYLAGALLACILAQAMRCGEGTAGKLAVALSCVLAFVIVFYYSYIPNLYNQSVWEVHHYNAVVQQIYNAAYDEPFTMESSGIYGHYAIFMWPFLKIFGHGPDTVALLLTVGLFIAQAAFIAIVFKLTKINALRAAAILAGVSFYMTQFYGAVWPIRVLWPLIILTYILYGDGKAEKRPGLYWGLGYVLCGLAIIWSTDSGIVATAAYTFSLWLRVWRRELPLSKNALKTYLLTLLGCAGSIALMVAVINIYNILCGGPLVLRACFFPILGGQGYVAHLQAQLGAEDNMFFLPVIIFMISIAVGTLSLRGIEACKTDRLCLSFCGLMGLGQSYYFFNRATATWDSVAIYFVLCLTFMAGFVLTKGERNIHVSMKRAAGVVSIIFLSAMVFSTLYRSPTFLNDKMGQTVNTMDSLARLSRAVESEVPKDTYAFGYLTQDVYAYLGWDPGYHKRDSSDMMGEGIENVYKEISDHDTILVARSNYSAIAQNCPEFTIVKEISIDPEKEDGLEWKAGFYLLEKTGG